MKHAIKDVHVFAINENICPKGRRHDRGGLVRILVPIALEAKKTSRSRMAITVYLYVLMFLNKL